MSQSEFNEKFFDHLLEDYFAEADEHLRSIRRHLLAFEDTLRDGSDVDRKNVNELFRSFHTIKGISAMAEVTAAEALAHHLEGLLRALRDGHTSLSQESLDVMLAGTRKLEQIIVARKNNDPIPSIDAEIERIEKIDRSADSQASAPTRPTRSGGSSGETAKYRVFFEPSTELAARNLNVSSVRDRLEKFGTIEESKPVIRGEGKIAFEFLVMVRPGGDLTEIEKLREDGISVTAVTDGESSWASESPFAEPVDVGHIKTSNVVRVDLARLDELMLIVGELVISRAKLSKKLSAVEDLLPVEHSRDLHEINQSLEKQLRSLRDGVMRVRMVPLAEVFERMRFVARDLARDSKKRVRIDVTGEETEIDKLLVERMVDPLLHLVRNSVSHGIEEPEDRLAADKSTEGVICLHAATVGDSVVIEVSDDGRGVDASRVAERARELGLLEPGAGIGSDQELLDILCAPGFSTTREADRASGRGVGMDVVKRVVDEMGGSMSLETARSTGTTFTIRLPLTLAITDALIASVGGQRFAVPQSSVQEVIEVDPGSVRKLENLEVIEYRGGALPLVRLSRLFSIPENGRKTVQAFVVNEGVEAVGLAVDRVIGQQEIVINAINDPIAKVPAISGATELGDGRAVLILNVSEIAKSHKRK